MRFFCHKPGKLLDFRQCTAPHATLCLCLRKVGKIKNGVVIERFSLPRVCLRVLSQSPFGDTALMRPPATMTVSGQLSVLMSATEP